MFSPRASLTPLVPRWGLNFSGLFRVRRLGPWLRPGRACGLAALVLWPMAGAMAGARTWMRRIFFCGPGTDEGLPENSVTAITQTRDGYLWLTTYAGLARFDGVRLTIYTSANTPGLQSDRLTSLYEDRQGNLWIGHERGDLTRYRNGKFEPFNFNETGARRKISAIGEDEAGDIWMLNEEGRLTRARDGASCSLPNNNGVSRPGPRQPAPLGAQRRPSGTAQKRHARPTVRVGMISSAYTIKVNSPSFWSIYK